MPSAMELREFLSAIGRSPVLDDERRERYREAAASLSAERRAEIVLIIRRHEDDFMAAVRQREVRASDEVVADGVYLWVDGELSTERTLTLEFDGSVAWTRF